MIISINLILVNQFKGAFFWAYSGTGITGMIRKFFLFGPELITDMSKPVNSVPMKVLQPLWNQSSPRTNDCLAYSNYSYSGIGPKECTLNKPHQEKEMLLLSSKVWRHHFENFSIQTFKVDFTSWILVFTNLHKFQCNKKSLQILELQYKPPTCIYKGILWNSVSTS